MMSGEMPSMEKGMSSWRYVIPHVPFWPWRDENLSPICGTRMERILILTTSLAPALFDEKFVVV